MTCQECTELLLEEEFLPEGVPGGEFSRTAVDHLGKCEDCRGLAGTLRANAVALRSMREDVVPSKPVVVIGSNLLSMRSAQQRPERWYWLAAAAALVVAVGFGVMRMNRPVATENAQQVTATRPEVAGVLPSITYRAGTRVAISGHDPGQMRTQLKAEELLANFKAQSNLPQGPSPIKIITGDPNVVIYWLAPDLPTQETSEGEIL